MERHTCIPLFITWNIRLSLEVTSLLGMANYHSSSLLPISHVQHTQANSFSPLDLPFGPLTNQILAREENDPYSWQVPRNSG